MEDDDVALLLARLLATNDPDAIQAIGKELRVAMTQRLEHLRLQAKLAAPAKDKAA